MHERSTRLLIASLRYSENLGDGLIAECFRGLAGRGEHKDISEFDFSGRTQQGGGGGLRSAALPILHRLPRLIANLVVEGDWLLRKRRSVDAAVPSPLSPADTVAFCGGQIIADTHLNFPLKVRRVVEHCERARSSVIFNSVGVGGSWSRRGRYLMRLALRSHSVVSITVRDAISQRNLRRHFDIEAALSADPALFAKDFLPPEPTSHDRIVGIGVACAQELSSALGGRQISGGLLLEELAVLAKRLTEAGLLVRLFTNGAPEDEGALQELSERLKADEVPFTKASRPRYPSELVQTLAQLETVVAFRLHAIIGAVALGRAAVPILWDAKVEGFAHEVGLAHVIQPEQGFGARAADVVTRGSNRADPRLVCALKTNASMRLAALLGDSLNADIQDGHP